MLYLKENRLKLDYWKKEEGCGRKRGNSSLLQSLPAGRQGRVGGIWSVKSIVLSTD